MKKIIVLKSLDLNSVVKIEEGELISYKKNNEELIHQKGNPGWRNSDTEMFPVIGPTENNNFIVSTPKGNFNQDQHGLLRELNYHIESEENNICVFKKTYEAYTEIENSKYPEKSSVPLVSWPYSFSFLKMFELSNDTLKITFEIETKKGMPFMLGYHPAFMLQGKLEELITSKDKEVGIPQIMKGGNTAYPILNSNEISLIKKVRFNLSIKTKGFNNFMLWTPVKNMLCIEPITKYPYIGNKALSEEMFLISKGKECFNI